MVRSNKTPAFWSVDCPFRRKFRVMKVSLERCFNVSLPLPLFPGSESDRFSSLKGFCSAPLERKSHLWDTQLLKVGKRTRYSIWMSLFLFRKILPAKSPCTVEVFLDRLSEESPDPDPKFLQFIETKIEKMFRVGWDRGYERTARNAVISTSACAEKNRSSGGARMYYLEVDAVEARKEFISYLLGELPLREEYPATIREVVTAGKVRILSVPSATEQALLPFHKVFYNHLSRFDWLLRGDATAKKFSDFLKVEGEQFVSGDYESATDCLNQKVQKHILECVLSRCVYTPANISSQALESLSPLLKNPETDRTIRMRKGQMMGYPISFPLLCLVNYLAFKYVVKRRVPLKINGDDIVFRATKEESDQWMTAVGNCGLKLSIGKTLVDRSIFTLNSTLFASGSHKVKALPFIRTKSLFGSEDSEFSLPGRWSAFAPSFGSRRRFRLRAVFLRQNIGYITRSFRSLNRGLGIAVSQELLRTCRLYGRECRYLSLPKESPPPVPRGMFNSKPEGYRIEYSEKRKVMNDKEQEEFIQAVVSAAWKKDDPEQSLSYEQYHNSGIRLPKVDFAKFSRLSGSTIRSIKEAMKKDHDRIFSDYRPKRLFPYWKKIDNLSSSANDEDEETNENGIGCCRFRPMIFSTSTI